MCLQRKATQFIQPHSNTLQTATELLNGRQETQINGC